MADTAASIACSVCGVFASLAHPVGRLGMCEGCSDEHLTITIIPPPKKKLSGSTSALDLPCVYEGDHDPCGAPVGVRCSPTHPCRSRVAEAKRITQHANEQRRKEQEQR